MSSRYIYIWRASVASETLTGVTQSKIGDVCLLASERSERDTYRGKNEKIGDVYWRASVASETVLGVDNAKSGICYIYMCSGRDSTSEQEQEIGK